MVVLSPPGITNPSRPSSSSARRTSRVSAPSCSSTTRCSRKSPCRARTPTVKPAPGPSRSWQGSGDRIQSSRRVPLLALMPPSGSPAAMLDLGFFGQARGVDAGHRLAEADGDLGDDLGVAIVGRRLDDGVGALLRILALEDAGADKDALRAELHHEGGVGGRGDAAVGEVDPLELAVLIHPADQLAGRGQLLGGDVQLVRIERGEAADLAHDGAHVKHGLDDVAGAGLALGAQPRGALADAAQGLTEVHGAADEGHLELPLVDLSLIHISEPTR